LARFHLPGIENVGVQLTVSQSKYLREFVLNSLGFPAVIDINVSQNPLLEELKIPDWQFARAVSFDSNDRLPFIDLPDLIQLSTFSAQNNPGLKVINLPELTGVGFAGLQNSFSIIGNKNLERLKIDGLSLIAGSFEVTGNSKLNSCDVITTVARIKATPSPFSSTLNVDVTNNDDSGMLGSISITSQAVLNALQGSRCVSGGVYVSGNTISDLSALEGIEATLDGIAFQGVTPTGTVAFPALKYVGTFVVITNSVGSWNLKFSALRRARGFNVYNDYGVRTLIAPMLEGLRDKLELNKTDKLENITLPALRSVGQKILIQCNTRLQSTAIADIVNGIPQAPPVVTICGGPGLADCQPGLCLP